MLALNPANIVVDKEQCSPIYNRVILTYRRNADLYDGGATMVRKANLYLTQHPFETNDQYKIRLRRAAYRNYAAPTVDLFASAVTKNIERNGIDKHAFLAPLLENCDRHGNSADKFFKGVITRAAAVGAAFVLVDMPQTQTPANTMRDAKVQGLSPYFVHVPAKNVLDWGYDDDGVLNWVVIRDKDWVSPGPFKDYEEKRTITVWGVEGWQRFVSQGGSDYSLAGEGELHLGMVPLVPFLYEETTPMTGRSVFDDVRALLVRVFNQDSELDKMEFDAALPILAAFGLPKDEAEELVKATNNIWRFGDPNAHLLYVEPSGASFNAKRQQILDDVDAIREISLRQTKPKGAGVETAEAKRLDSVQISSQLAEFARNVAASERRCWQIAALMCGLGQEAAKNIQIKYSEAFDPDALHDKLTADFKELRAAGDISRETLLTQMGWDAKAIEKDAGLLAKERESTPATLAPVQRASTIPGEKPTRRAK